MPGKGWDVSDFMKAIREMGLENALDRWYSVYPATIVDDADESQQGKSRVKVSLLGFPDEHPRFSYPISPYAGRNFGFFFPPHKDSPAWVSFDMGDTNSARVLGGWWMNEPSDKRPATSHVPAEFVKSDGSSPTARGIKTQGGSMLAFDDDTENYFTEITSGKNPVEIIENRDAQGNVVGTVAQIIVGERAEKHHRIRLDDTREQIIVASFGDVNENAPVVFEADSPSTQANKELLSRLRHQITMRDKADDRFVEMKSIGDDDTNYHRVLLSDTDEKIHVMSTGQHFIEIDDASDRIVNSTADGFRTELNSSDKRAVMETPGSRVLRLDDDTNVITLNDSQHELTFDNSGTLLSDETGQPVTIQGQGNLSANFPSGNAEFNAIDWTKVLQGNRNVTITGNDTVSVTGNMTMNITGTLQKIAAMISMISSGSVTLTGTTVTVNSATVNIGTGTLQRLVNEIFVPLFNSHFHISGNPGAPTLSASASGFTAVNGIHTTIATSAA